MSDSAFNEDEYLVLNPGVAAAVKEGTFSSGREHYEMDGEREGRLYRANAMNILDEYVTSMPSAQNAMDLFSSEWSSQVPGFVSGNKGLSENTSITELFERAGGIEGKRVLELGPLEGAHTLYAFSSWGQRSYLHRI